MSNPASFNLAFANGVGPQPVPIPPNNATQQQGNMAAHQGVNHEAHNHDAGIPTMLTQQAIQDIVVDEGRIANMNAVMFNPFRINSGVQQVKIGNSAQANVRETADNEEENFEEGDALGRNGPEGNTPVGNTSRRERPLNMWITFRCEFVGPSKANGANMGRLLREDVSRYSAEGCFIPSHDPLA